LLSILILCSGVISTHAAAQPSDASYLTKEEVLARQKRAKEEQQAQKKMFRVTQYLEKGRKARYEGKFKSARIYGQRALKVDPDNYEAKAFLDQLDEEERLYEQEKIRLKEEKERKKREKKEAKRLARERKLAAKRAREEERRLAAEEKRKEKEEVKKPAAVKAAEPAAAEERPAEGEPEQEEPAAREPEQRKPAEEKPAEKAAEPVKAGKPAEEPAAKKKEAKEEEQAPEDILKYMKPGQPIIVDGDKVEYFEEEGRIVAEGNVSITYGDVKLTCDRIEVNTQTRRALCEGNVRIEQEEGVLMGDRIRYDFAEKEGEIIGGVVEAFPWFGQAEESGKVGPNEYLLRKGFITTCDLDKPHYRISGEEIRVFPDDKVIAKNVVFYVGKVPVLWMPYYYHPIIQSRAKVQFIPGSNTDWGYFLLSAWRFYVKGNSRVDVLLDYRDKKGFAFGEDFYYNTSDFGLEGLGEGIFRSYFVYQNGFGTYRKSSFRGEDTDPTWRKRFQWKHRIDFDPETIGMLEFNKLSDEYFLKDYFYNEYEESNTVPPNYLSVTSNKSNYIFTLYANQRFNDFFKVVQRMPELKMDIPDQRLWNTPIYYGSQWSAVNFVKEYPREEQPPEKVARLDSYHKLSYVTHIGPLNLTPYGTFRESLYTRTRWDHDIKDRMAVGGGLDTFMRFHRTFDYNTDLWGLDINGLRHIIVPTANYYHLHQPTLDERNLYHMDELDLLRKENGIFLSLENKLQTKRHTNGGLKTMDLVRTIVSVDYLFRMEKNNYQFQDDGKFRNLALDIELSPYSWLYVDSRIEIAPKNQAIKAGSIEASVYPSERFSLDLGYRYEKQVNEPRNQLTFDTWYVISPKWKVGVYERFDIQGRTIEEQQYTLVRDLHCWEVELTYDIEGSNFLKDKYAVWLAFRIKAFPDLYIGLSRSFTKRAPGSSLR